MKPLQLKLTNFKGVRDGLGLDSIEIDLSQLSGLVAFCGTNGSAKTTCLDNLHPYREMPSRGGSFYDQVLGNAKKEFVFEMAGNVYRSLILIDPKQKKQEAYLYVQHRDRPGEIRHAEWSALNKDGKTTTYDEQIEKLMGSSKLFFTSIFRAQGAKPISAQSKTDLKELFVELLMLDKYQIMADGAKELRKQDESKVSSAEYAIENLVRLSEGRNEKQEEKKQLIAEISVGEKDISEKKIKLESMYKELSSLLSKTAIQNKDVNRLDDLRAEIAKLDAKILDIKTLADERQKGIGIRLEEHKTKKARAEKILSGKAEIEARVITEQEFEQEQKSIREKIAALRKEIENIDEGVAEFSQLQYRTDALAKEIKRIETTASKLNGVPCKDMDIVANCPLVGDAISAKNSLPESKKNFANLESKRKRLQGIDERHKDKKQKVATLQTRLDTVEKELSEGRKWTQLLPELKITKLVIQEAEKEIGRLEKEYNDLKAEVDNQQAGLNEEINLKKNEVSGILLSIDDDLNQNINDCREQVNTANTDLQQLDRIKTKWSKDLGMVEEAIKNIEKAGGELERLRGEVKTLNVEISEWLLLEKALGKDGLIALEIDDAGPSISTTANELLQACFGTRFTVRIDTTRPSKDGKKLMEVFDIKVLDGDSEEEKTILDLSGGEKVWVQSAITQAIAIRNKELSERSFSTCLEDEVDGALSRQNKERFFQMKKKSMELGGFEETIFISQDPEIWQMADSRVVFEKSKGIEIIGG